MKIGYYVQGSMDEAVVHGLAARWCPAAQLARGAFRGSSGISLRRELLKALRDLRDDKHCDVLVVLTDSDAAPWRDIKRNEWGKVPEDCQHLCVFGVAERNIECWLAADRGGLAQELGCDVAEIPPGDPSGFVKRRFGIERRDEARNLAKTRVEEFVARAELNVWIRESESFADFYGNAKALASRLKCQMPNERD